MSKRIQKGYVLFSPLFFATLVLEGRGGEGDDILILKGRTSLCRIKEIPELFIIGRPDMTIVAFGSDVVDIFEINDVMSSKGWHLNALQRPNRYFHFYFFKARK